MKIIIETERLIIRELECTDENDLFKMDSDPEVHLYIENNPKKTTDEIQNAIKIIKKQYEKYGIARWAVTDKLTNECIGWSGLKFFNQPLNPDNSLAHLLQINATSHPLQFLIHPSSL